MSEHPPRIATLVLCTRTGEVLGSLPPFEAVPSWWPDTVGLVRGVQERHGVRVVVLRLLSAAGTTSPGGEVSYLAEVDERLTGGLPLTPWPGVLEPQARRLSYAEPGGPAQDLAWATAALAARGVRQRGQAEQVKSWNLSSLWRIPTERGNAWLKVVPPFFAHEGDVLSLLHDAPVPRLWAHEGGRILMPEIPGDDLYGAPLATLVELVSMLVRLQVRWTGRTAELLALGLPDWRAPSLAELIGSVVRRNEHDLAGEDRQALDSFVAELPRRFRSVAECGIPDTLVHGDFAPGNARGDGDRLVVLDWGDCGVGHPLLDQSAFLDRIDPAFVDRVSARWESAWREQAPGADPRRAARLLAPVSAARQAVIYQGFLDQIEPSEHPYHRSDPALWLSRTASLVRAEAGHRAPPPASG